MAILIELSPEQKQRAAGTEDPIRSFRLPRSGDVRFTDRVAHVAAELDGHLGDTLHLSRENPDTGELHNGHVIRVELGVDPEAGTFHDIWTEAKQDVARVLVREGITEVTVHRDKGLIPNEVLARNGE